MTTPTLATPKQNKTGTPAKPLGAGQRVLNEHEAAEMLGLDVTTLRDWRFRRIGPPYLKYLSKAVTYILTDLTTFMERSRIQTAA